MTKSNQFTLVLLIVLTIGSAFCAQQLSDSSRLGGVTNVLLFLSGLKFLLVSFQFMALKNAHVFWKVAVSVYLVVFIGIVMVLF